MKPEDAKIKARLEEVLQSIFCPVGGCWRLHGCHLRSRKSLEGLAAILYPAVRKANRTK